MEVRERERGREVRSARRQGLLRRNRAHLFLPLPQSRFSLRPGKMARECNASSLIEYSDLCLGPDPPADCYPSVKSTPAASSFAVVFHTLNIFFGLNGNLLTLLSIPYARRQRRFGFQARDCYFSPPYNVLITEGFLFNRHLWNTSMLSLSTVYSKAHLSICACWISISCQRVVPQNSKFFLRVDKRPFNPA